MPHEKYLENSIAFHRGFLACAGFSWHAEYTAVVNAAETDMEGERLVSDTRSISPHVNEQTVEISLRNRKNQPAAITAVGHFWGDWEIPGNR